MHRKGHRHASGTAPPPATATGGKRWFNGWTSALDAFEITFDGRLPAEGK
jgi:hypothetical protein